MIKLWNTLTHTREVFGSIHPQEVRIYSCGPTVYGRAHVGNLRGYVVWDVLKRLFRAQGYKVVDAMNITDVGHLTDDADSGEDKLQKKAQEQGESAWDIAKKYEELFKQDTHALNIILPQGELLCRATDHIQDQIKMVETLLDKGFAYQISDGIYFDTAKFPEYGKLSGQKLEEKKEGARVAQNQEKHNPTDFALWKFSYPNGRDYNPDLDKDIPKRHMEWQSPWGLGFPGWHIECSAMSSLYLGQPFDIHTGGVDHIAVHHENEIAQSMATHGVALAKFWLHNEFLTVDGQKMSKSLGNVYTLEDCQKHNIDPLALRYFYLGAHYRTKLNFTWDAVQGAQNALNKLRETVREWDETTKEVDLEWKAQFLEKIDDDIDTPGALAVLWGLVKSDLESSKKSATILFFDSILGLGLDKYIAQGINVPNNIKKLADRRWEARINKDWALADQLRNELETLGWKMEDADQGYKLKPLT